MRNDHRQFYIYDLEVAAVKNGAMIPDMPRVMAVWQKMAAAKRTMPIRKDTATLLIGEIQVNAAQDFATLLIRLSDKTAPNSVYSDPVVGNFEEHIKGPGQGADYGCHVFISMAPEKGLPNTYTCAIEKMPGLSADLVQRVLSKMLNIEHHAGSFFTYPDPGGGLKADGSPKTEKCCPHVVLKGRPSDAFINDLNGGTLTGVSLVKTMGHTPIAGAAYLTTQRAELTLGINRQTLPKQGVWDTLKTVIKQNAPNYNAAKVAYRLPGATRAVTVEIDASTGAPLSDLYVRSYEVTKVFPFLAQSAENIVPHLQVAATQQFLANRDI